MSITLVHILTIFRITTILTDIEERDEGKTKLATVSRNVKLEDVEGVLDGGESNDLLKEVERIITKGSVGEVGNGGGTRPRNNRHKENAGDDGALDTVHHEHDSEESATEDANPLRGVRID
jgi:hypothetical protein